MRLSRIWRILQISEGVIQRGLIIHSKYFLLLQGVSPLRSLFFRSPNITQPCPQVFSVNGSIICGGLYFWRHWFNMAKILSKFGEQQLVMVNYACGLNQSETGKYFEWIIKTVIVTIKDCWILWRRSLCSVFYAIYDIWRLGFLYAIPQARSFNIHHWSFVRESVSFFPANHSSLVFFLP